MRTMPVTFSGVCRTNCHLAWLLYYSRPTGRNCLSHAVFVSWEGNWDVVVVVVVAVVVAAAAAAAAAVAVAQSLPSISHKKVSTFNSTGISSFAKHLTTSVNCLLKCDSGHCILTC